KSDASDFTASDRESLMAVSRAASTALENALAYQRIRWAEERLKQYAEVVKSMQVGLSIWRLENPHDPRTFRLVVSNPAAERAPGGYAQEFCGKTMAEGFPALFETEIPKILQQVVLSGEGRDLGEIRYRDQNVPEDVFLAKTFPLPDNCAGITLENITRHKRAEEALRRAELPYKELSSPSRPSCGVPKRKLPASRSSVKKQKPCWAIRWSAGPRNRPFGETAFIRMTATG